MPQDDRLLAVLPFSFDYGFSQLTTAFLVGASVTLIDHLFAKDVIGAVEVVPGAGGIFDVHVDGELVFTKSMLGRYPEPDEVAPLLRERLERA